MIHSNKILLLQAKLGRKKRIAVKKNRREKKQNRLVPNASKVYPCICM